MSIHFQRRYRLNPQKPGKENQYNQNYHINAKLLVMKRLVQRKRLQCHPTNFDVHCVRNHFSIRQLLKVIVLINLSLHSKFDKKTLAAHTKTHAGANSCQYCQKNFALPTALVNHLRDHCTNISIAERKKLLAANEKTPNLDCTSRSQRTPKKTPNSVKHLTDELIEFVSRSCSASQSNRVIDSLSEYFPPIKGVYQTPKKVIKCYNCGQNFKHAFLFAAHAELCAVDSKK